MYQSQFNHSASNCALVVKWFSNLFWHFVICVVKFSWAGEYFILSTPNSQEMRRVKKCLERCPHSSCCYDTSDPFIICLEHLIDLLHLVLTNHNTCGVATLQAVWACVLGPNWQNWSELTTTVLRQKQKGPHFACFSLAPGIENPLYAYKNVLFC